VFFSGLLGLAAMTKTQTRLLLIRHGQTSWNAAGLWQGHGNPELSVEGRAQADRLARSLHEEKNSSWTKVITSDLARAHQTAVAVADVLSLPIEIDLRLRELDVGTWSGLSRSEITSRDLETLRAFERGEPMIRPGGGESRIEIRERTHEFVCDLVNRSAGRDVIVVTHLGVIRALVPGAEPGNAERIEVIAEDLAAQPIDRHRRAGEGPL
jgi:broad specificity phosphatase PhoE